MRNAYVGGDIDFTGDLRLVYICFIIILLLVLYVFIIILLKGRAFKDNYLYDMAFGKFGRFLWIPILINGGMVLIPFVFNDIKVANRDDQAAAIAALVMNLLVLFGYIFIYCMLPKCNENIYSFVFKKCFLSAAASYQIYFFFNNLITIFYFGDQPLNTHADSRRTASWICICIFGVIIGLLTWFWKDVCMGGMGLLFQIGFFVLSNGDKPIDKSGRRNKGNYFSSIIFTIALAVEIGFLIATKKKEVLQ